MKKYISTRTGIQECDDLLEWARWFEESCEVPFEDGGRRVLRDDLPDGAFVSTIFLGMNHNWGGGPPLLFETMILDRPGDADEYQERYATVEEARAGHLRALAVAKGESS